jgi:hypothetical protein
MDNMGFRKEKFQASKNSLILALKHDLMKVREDKFLNLRKDNYESIMSNKRYSSLNTNLNQDEMLLIKIDKLNIHPDLIKQINDSDIVI